VSSIEPQLAKALLDLCLMTFAMDSAEVGRHVRYPAHARSSLRGSEQGATLWASEPGKLVELKLLNAMRAAPGTRPDAAVDFLMAEVHGRVASFVESARAAPDMSQFVSEQTNRLIDEMTQPPSGAAVWLLAGIRVPDEGISIAGGAIELVPARRETVPPELLSAVNVGWETLPRQTMGLATTRVALPSRASPLPALDAVMESVLLQHDLAIAIWLSTGHKPTWIVRWMGEQAAFPAAAWTHEARSRFAGGLPELCPSQLLSADATYAAFLRIHDREWLGFDDDSFDLGTSVALRAAFYLLDAMDQSIEGAQLLLQAYSAMEGLLAASKEDSRIIRRSASLIGSGARERRLLQERLKAVRAYRNAIAHGSRPSWEEAQAAAGLSGLNPGDLTDRHTLEQELRRQAHEYLRCAFGSFLWFAAEPAVQDGRSVSRPLLTKQQIIDLLDRSRSADAAERQRAEAALGERLPLWLRDPLGRFTV
jgi:hypothetical protein